MYGISQKTYIGFLENSLDRSAQPDEETQLCDASFHHDLYSRISANECFGR
jgi:hypothetical protein